MKIAQTNSNITKIAIETPLSFYNKLLSWNVLSGNFSFYAIDFLSNDDRLMIPSIVSVRRFTLDGN